jgi:hypothetical protein
MYVPAVQSHCFVPMFGIALPAGILGPQPLVQDTAVVVSQVVTLSVTPPSTANVQSSRVPEELPVAPDDDPPDDVAPEVVPLVVAPLVVPEVVAPDVVPVADAPEVEAPELEAVEPESAPVFCPVVEGLLLLLQPTMEDVAPKEAAAVTMVIQTAAFIVVSLSSSRRPSRPRLAVCEMRWC